MGAFAASTVVAARGPLRAAVWPARPRLRFRGRKAAGRVDNNSGPFASVYSASEIDVVKPRMTGEFDTTLLEVDPVGPDLVILRPLAEITRQTVAAADAALAAIATGGDDPRSGIIILDGVRLSRFGSTAVGWLLGLRRSCHQRHGRLMIRDLPATAWKFLRLLRLDLVFEMEVDSPCRKTPRPTLPSAQPATVTPLRS